MASLRDCPFCAHDRCEVVELDDQPGEAYVVACPECGARGPVDPTPEYAAYKWNRRDELPPGADDDNDSAMMH